MKPSMISLSVLISALAPSLAFADCPLNSKQPKFNCTSYEIGLPLNITNSVGGASLTVMDGNVGIGILSPVATLDIQSEGTAVNESQLILRNPNTGANSAVTTNAYSSGEWRGSQYYIKNGSGTVYGVSTANTSGTPTERMRITDDGKIGIKTATPGSELHVNGTIRAEEICDQSGSNCKTISTGWGSGGGGGSGTVTSITAGTGLTGGTITTTGTIAVDVGTSANKVVQLNSSGALPAVSGANLTDVNATNLNGTTVATSGNSNGQVLSYNGSAWTNKSLAISDVGGLSTNLGSKIDASNMPASCAANQTLTFSSPTGMWSCSDIAVTPATFGSQTNNMVLASPSGAAGIPSFRNLTVGDMPFEVSASLWTWNGPIIWRGSRVGIGSTGDMNAQLAVSTTEGYTDPSFALSLEQRSNNADAQIRTRYMISGAYRGSIVFIKDGITPGSKFVLNNTDTSGAEMERLRINTNGNVGIGTTNPTSSLHVETPATFGAFSPQLNLSNASTADYSMVTTNYYSSGDYRGSTWFMKDGSGLGTITGLSTTDGTGASVERIRITAEGKMGIGTNNPSSRLEVAGTLRVDEICDRSGSNCKTLAGGWALPSGKDDHQDSTLNRLTRENSDLRKQNIEILAQLNALAEQVKILGQKSQSQTRKVANSK